MHIQPCQGSGVHSSIDCVPLLILGSCELVDVASRPRACAPPYGQRIDADSLCCEPEVRSVAAVDAYLDSGKGIESFPRSCLAVECHMLVLKSGSIMSTDRSERHPRHRMCLHVCKVKPQEPLCQFGEHRVYVCAVAREQRNLYIFTDSFPAKSRP